MVKDRLYAAARLRYNRGAMLTDVYKRDGVRLAEAFGGPYPEYFIHPAAEYQALTRYAGLIDLTHWRTLKVTGKDRVGFLNAMLTNDVAALETNQGTHSLITTVKGKIVAELYVFARQDDVLVMVAQGSAGEANDILEKHIIMEDVTVEDISDAFGVLALEGPKLDDTLWRLFAKGPFPKENLHAVARTFEAADIYLMRNSVSGENGYHLMIPAEDLERLRAYLVQACRGTDGLPVGRLAWNMRRIENGLSWYGADFTDDNLPDESRLGDAISYAKGCFHGQETLARLHHRGHVNRVLVGLTVEDAGVPAAVAGLRSEFEGEINNYDESGLEERAAPLAGALDFGKLFPAGTELYPAGGGDDEAGGAHPAPGREAGHHGAAGVEEKSVGRITSAAYSPVLGKPLLLGYVRVEFIEKRQSVRPAAGPTLTMVDLPAARTPPV
ncbi:MAG: YgfZ/GcvT domain-containing protein [Candidatus Krumholzibacteriia bacterium]